MDDSFEKGISQFLVIIFIFVGKCMPDRLMTMKFGYLILRAGLKLPAKLLNNISSTKNCLIPFFTNTVLLYILYLRYYTHKNNNYNIILVIFIDDHSYYVTSRYSYTRSYFG